MAEELIIDEKHLKWHHIDDPDDPELVVLAAQYSLHELALEDCRMPSARVKMDDYEEYLFIILNAPRFVAADDRLSETRLCVFVGEGFIVTVSDGPNQAVHHVKIMYLGGKILPSEKHIFHALVDTVCDQFLPALDLVSEEIGEMEQTVHERPDTSISKHATAMKRVLTLLRRSAVGHREIINHLLRRHPPFGDHQLHLYFRDIYDHLVQAIEMIELDRDLLTGIIDINLATTAHRTNEIVKTLTIYATVLLPLNLITGFFGMNFSNMPLIHEKYGVETVTLCLISLAICTTFFFQKREW